MFSELEFKKQRSRLRADSSEEEQWVKDLNMNKVHLTERDKYQIQEILEDNEISLELLAKSILQTRIVSEELSAVRTTLANVVSEYDEWIAKEKEQIEESKASMDSEATQKKVARLKKLAHARLKEATEEACKTLA
jgi:hypothetical protein